MFPALLLGTPLNLSPTLTLKEVDLLLLTGDITNAGQSEEWPQFFELMDPVLLHKTIIIPGNQGALRRREEFGQQRMGVPRRVASVSSCTSEQPPRVSLINLVDLRNPEHTY